MSRYFPPFASGSGFLRLFMKWFSGPFLTETPSTAAFCMDPSKLKNRSANSFPDFKRKYSYQSLVSSGNLLRSASLKSLNVSSLRSNVGCWRPVICDKSL